MSWFGLVLISEQIDKGTDDEYAHRYIEMLYKQPPCLHSALNKWERLPN